jgi:hypothetical protein
VIFGHIAYRCCVTNWTFIKSFDIPAIFCTYERLFEMEAKLKTCLDASLTKRLKNSLVLLFWHDHQRHFYWLLAQIRIEGFHEDRLKRAPRCVAGRVRIEPRVPGRIEPQR